MNIIYEKTGVYDTMKFMYIDSCINGVSPKVPRKSLLTLHQRKRKNIPKKTQKTISNIPKDFMVAVEEDESIFVHDAVIRRKMWMPEGVRPVVVTITGSHQKTCVFGVLSIDGI